MKRSIAITLLSCLLGVTAVATAVSTIAWFKDIADLAPADFNGATEGSYFAAGNGTSENPFILNKPRHLYNLAWLNMRGYFENRDIDKDGNSNDLFYFKIDPSLEGTLDGDGLIIPPIGTKEHPFYGHFDGSAKTISNFVIDSDRDNYVQHPYNMDDFMKADPEIVGLFGVVGPSGAEGAPTEPSSSEASTIYNLAVGGVTIKTSTQQSLVGIVAGYVNGTIQNVVVDKTSSIVISESTTGSLSNYSNKISEYSTIGYCTTNYSENQVEGQYNKKNIKRNVHDIYTVNTDTSQKEFDAHELGEDLASGGSIDMYDMYSSLHTIWTTITNNGGTYKSKYYTGNRTITIDENGEETGTGGTAANTYNNFNTAETTAYNGEGSSRHSYYNYTQSATINSESIQTASYTYVVEPQNSSDYRFMCLTGKKQVTVPNGATMNATMKMYPYQIYYQANESSAKNYLAFTVNTDYWGDISSVTINNSTTDGDSTYWFFDGANIQADVDGEGNIYYLNCDSSGNLSMGTSSSTTWTYNTAKKYFVTEVSSTKYYLGFNGTSWVTSFLTDEVSYWTISDGTRYMAHSSNNNRITGSTTVNDNTKWLLDGSNHFYYVSNGTTYYLKFRYQSSWGSRTYRCYASNSSSSGYYYFEYDPNQTYSLFATYNNTKYYPNYSGSNFDGTTTQKSMTIVNNVTPAHYSAGVTHEGIEYKIVEDGVQKTFTVSGAKSKIQTVDTYFPLKPDSTNGADKLNTGYVVSGPNYQTSDDPFGDIRVSQYPTNSLSNYSNNKISTVYTVNGQTISLNNHIGTATTTVGGTTYNFKYEKYENTKSSVEQTIKDQKNIYGFHFMMADINIDNLITAPWVKVADKSKEELTDPNVVPYHIYRNYEMPEDSIDFHLRDTSVINFMAGTYYTGTNQNTSFFSLHQIFRYKDGDSIPAGKKANDIRDIKEIDVVYKNTDEDTSEEYPYVYKFVNENAPSNAGDVVFKTEWITNPSNFANNRAYYFEIPANKGEYALGSVKGKSGAYLMYLDIAANANKISRTKFGEHFINIEETYDYPIGVSIVDSISTTTVNGNPVITSNPLNSANIIINPGYQGELTLNRTSATALAVTVANGHSGDVSQGYVNNSIVVSGVSSRTPRQTITSDTKRVELFDYGVNSNALTRTVVTKTTYTGVCNIYSGNSAPTVTPPEQVYTIIQYKYKLDGVTIDKTLIEGGEDEIKAYDPSNQGRPYTNIKDDVFALYSAADNEDIIYEFLYFNDETQTITVDFDMQYLKTTGTNYYEVNGYDVLIEVTGSSIIVYVKNTSGGYSIFTFNSNTITDGQITIPVS